jgi:hypothetical protein
MAEGEAVWNGSAWVHPSTGQQWDGQRWVDPAPATGATAAFAAPAPAPGEAVAAPPERGVVFIQVAWRTVVAAVGGGAAVGTGMILLFALWDVVHPPSDGADPSWTFIPIGTLFGIVFGGFLGAPAAAILGGVMAWRGVPYPGPKRTRLIARITAMAMVFAFLVLFFHEPVQSGGPDVADLTVYGLIYGASLVGAWFLGSWTVRWYVRRMAAVVGA